MAIDRVQVLKQESAALGGDDADSAPWPAPIEPQEDAIEAAGLYLQDNSNRDENVSITRAGDDMSFTDVTNPSYLLSNFAVLIGRVGGQTFIGSQDSTGDLTLQSTSNASKGHILFGNSGYDEANNRLGIGILAPTVPLDVAGASRFGTGPYVSIPASANEIDFSNNGPNYFDATAASGDFRFRTNGSTEVLNLDTTSLRPVGSRDLGATGSRWSHFYATRCAIGTAPFSANVAVNIERTSAAAATEYAVLAEHIFSSTFSSVKIGVESRIVDDRSAGVLSDVRGFYSFYDKNDIAGVTAYFGYRSNFDIESPTAAANIGQFNHFFGEGVCDSDTTIENLYGFRYNEGTLSGTVDNQYGIFIGSLTQATESIGVYIATISTGTNDYALYVTNGKTHHAHTYTGTVSRTAHYFRYDTDVSGSATQRCILSTMYGNPSVAYTSTMTNIYSQSIKQGANNITSWNGVLSAIQDSGAGGTLTNWRSFQSAVNKDGFNITYCYHYHATDATGSGTIGTQVGLYVEKLDDSTKNYGIYLTGVGDGGNDYAIYSLDGRTYFKHTYGGSSSWSAAYFEYVLLPTVGNLSHQGILSRMRTEIGQNQTGTMTHLYVQTLKSDWNGVDDGYDVTSWIGIRSRLQEDGTTGGTIALWRAFFSDSNLGGFDVTTFHTYYASHTAGTGSVQTLSGLYVEKLTNGTADNYGIYLGGSGAGANDYAMYSDDGQVYLRNVFTGSTARNHLTADFTVTRTGSSSQFWAHYSTITPNFSSSQTGTYGVINARVQKTDASNHTASMCMRATLTNAGSPSGKITTHYGIYSEVNAAGFDVDNVRHFYVANAAGADAVATQYGLHIADLDKGTTNHGVYIEGASSAAIYVVKDICYFGGDVGIGDASNPQANLHIKSTGDAGIWIEADSDNSGETDNPYIKITQDGALADAVMGFCGGSGRDPQYIAYTGALNNAFLIGRRDNLAGIQFGTNTTVRLTINSSGHVVPGGSNTYTLGLSGTSWKNIFAENPAAYRGVTAASYRVVIPAGAFSADHNTSNGASMRVDNTSSLDHIYWELGEDDYITAALPVPHNDGASTYTLTEVTLYVTSVASSGTLYVSVYRTNYNSSARTLVGSGSWTTGDGQKTISLSHAVVAGSGYTILVYKDGTGSMFTYSASAVFSMASPAVAWNA